MVKIGRIFSNTPVLGFIVLLFFGVIAMDFLPGFFAEGSIDASLPVSRLTLFIIIAAVLVIDIMVFHFSRIVLSIFILISCTLLFSNIVVGLAIAFVHYLLLGTFTSRKRGYGGKIRRSRRIKMPRRYR